MLQAGIDFRIFSRELVLRVGQFYSVDLYLVMFWVYIWQRCSAQVADHFQKIAFWDRPYVM